MVSLFGSNRKRIKAIRYRALQGPVAAFRSWRNRRDRLAHLTQLNAPDIIIERERTLVHDAAYAVKVSRALNPQGLNDPRSEISRHAREACAEHGYEMTPAELIAERKSASDEIRAGLREKGWPMPDDDEALLELLKAINREATAEGREEA